jgi:hypothetical protein
MYSRGREFKSSNEHIILSDFEISKLNRFKVKFYYNFITIKLAKISPKTEKEAKSFYDGYPTIFFRIF